MSNSDWSNSEVRDIPISEYDPNKNKYLEAYSFILSWGWKRKKIAEDAGGIALYKWVDSEEGYTCDTVYEAQSIQRLRLVTNGTSKVS